MPVSFAAVPKLRQLGSESSEFLDEIEADENEPAISR